MARHLKPADWAQRKIIERINLELNAEKTVIKAAVEYVESDLINAWDLIQAVRKLKEVCRG